MSYHLEYRYLVSRVPAEELADGIDRFFVCIEAGDSNCYDHSGPRARRSRSWRVGMLGTLEDIMEQACYYAVGCEEGLRVQGKTMTAESYIKKIRNLVEAAIASGSSVHATAITLKHHCPPGSPDEIMLSSKGISKTEGKTAYTNTAESRFSFAKPDGTADFATFFEVYPQINQNRSASAFAACPSLY